jgi:hypothetical protein
MLLIGRSQNQVWSLLLCFKGGLPVLVPAWGNRNWKGLDIDVMILNCD